MPNEVPATGRNGPLNIGRSSLVFIPAHGLISVSTMDLRGIACPFPYIPQEDTGFFIHAGLYPVRHCSVLFVVNICSKNNRHTTCNGQGLQWKESARVAQQHSV